MLKLLKKNENIVFQFVKNILEKIFFADFFTAFFIKTKKKLVLYFLYKKL